MIDSSVSVYGTVRVFLQPSGEEWHQLHVLLGGWDLHHHECSQRASPLEILRLPCWNLQNLVQQRLPGTGLNLLLPQESQYNFLYLVTFHMFVSPISCDLCASTLMLLLTWHASCVPCCTYSSWLAMHFSPGVAVKRSLYFGVKGTDFEFSQARHTANNPECWPSMPYKGHHVTTLDM